jgi:hypothetical protein
MDSELNSVKNTQRNLDIISNRINDDDDVIINNSYTNKNKSISNDNDKLNTARKPTSQTFLKGTRTLKPKKEVKFNLNSTDKTGSNSMNIQQIL